MSNLASDHVEIVEDTLRDAIDNTIDGVLSVFGVGSSSDKDHDEEDD
jgi:hypothetical protein